MTRWKLKLARYDSDVTYKAGKTNINADALSRNPIDIENINDNDNNEGVNTSQIKLNKEDNMSNESKTDDDEEEAPHNNLYCNEELNQKEIEEIRKNLNQGKLTRAIQGKLNKQRTGRISLKIRIIKEIIINLNIRLMIMKILILIILEGTDEYRQRMEIFSKIIRVKMVTVA